MMGVYLTYVNGRSFATSGSEPDENFAREIMQLFTIGLWNLHPNGTLVRDASGRLIPSYTQDNVDTFSRVWTGFGNQNYRGNLEATYGRGTGNMIDPMKVNPYYHDTLPKVSLDGYLGDGYPLCSSFKYPFLVKGAHFIGTGAASISNLMDAEFWRGVGYFAPTPGSSALYAKLCASDGTQCTFPDDVVLDETLTCAGTQECGAEMVTVIKMVEGATIRYYSFSDPPPCVDLTFFSGKQTKYSRTQSMTGWADVTATTPEDMFQCSNPVFAAASPTCCTAAAPTTVTLGACPHARIQQMSCY
jgi:hypothetical protein